MTLDPDTEALLKWRMEIGAPYYQDMTPAAAREAMAAARAAANLVSPAIGEVRDLVANSGAHQIALRMYKPEGAGDENLPFMIFFHGGGWVVGDLDTHDILCRQLVIGSGCAVIAVDYRLAPEHRFPCALDDCEAAVRWIVANAQSLGLDVAKMAVGGDSAGGNIATIMALLARDGKLPSRFQFQLLAYPWVDVTMSHRSYGVAAEGLPVTAATLGWFRDHYLNGEEEQVNWLVSPLFAPNLRELPSAFILTAGYDPLHDEGEAYARRLEQAGVDVKHRHYPGQIHGFLTMGAQLPTAGFAVAELSAALKSALTG